MKCVYCNEREGYKIYNCDRGNVLLNKLIKPDFIN